jgi:formylglycine-generating enzyme required for sulfatase activity
MIRLLQYTILGAVALLGIAACDTLDFDPPAERRAPTDGSTVINSIGMKFARIPSGTFEMGSAQGEDNERPVHTVEISSDFYMSVHEVTQRQWEILMDENPSRFRDPFRPVERVTWSEAQRFIRALNEREEGARYRLPTEAEWEYAARAGTQTRYHFGDDKSALDRYAWYLLNSDEQTYPVKRKGANAFGLFDMHGNVWEWTQDFYHPTYYHWGPEADPQGPDTGRGYVIRGGGWADGPKDLRVANRGWVPPDFKVSFVGFRLVREVD